MKRNIITFCLAILLIFSLSFAVSADGFDQGRLGSISIALAAQEGNAPIIGAEFGLYHIATVDINSNGELNYEYTKAFETIKAPIDSESLVKKLDEFVAQKNIEAIKIKTDAQGFAVCKDLPLGLYLVRQTLAAEGFSRSTPFLVAVPMEKNGDYIYNVDASPKTEVEKLVSITIKKVWNTDASTKATDSISVQLLKNGSVIKTAKLSEENDWQITYTDMPESDEYSIKELAVPKGFTATYKQKGNVFTVTNSSTLIQTGQLIWPILLLVVSGMLLLAIGIIILQKKRETDA